MRFLLENPGCYKKFVKCSWHYLQLVIMESFLLSTLSICLFMDTQTSQWFKPQSCAIGESGLVHSEMDSVPVSVAL